MSMFLAGRPRGHSPDNWIEAREAVSLEALSKQALVEKALIHLEEALTLGPDLVEAHKWMAVIHSGPEYGLLLGKRRELERKGRLRRR